MSAFPDISPKSDDTRWRLQQIGMYAAGAFAAGCTSLIAFAVNIEDGIGPYISWLRSQLAGWLMFAFSLAIYKLVKWARISRMARQDKANAEARELAMAQLYFDTVKAYPKPEPKQTDTARIFANVTPGSGQHSASEAQEKTAGEIEADLRARRDTIGREEVAYLIKAVGNKPGPDWVKVRTLLLTIRGKMVDKGIWNADDEAPRTVTF